MTAPRWIVEAFAAACEPLSMGDCPGPDEFARQLLERLPLYAMRRAADGALANLGDGLAVSLRTEHAVAALVVAEIVREISERDPDVVTLTEIYQSAIRELDAAGVPYGFPSNNPPRDGNATLTLAGRIRWLAQQRPTRLELQRVEAERDALKTSNEAAFRDLAQAHREHDQLITQRDAQIELRATAERERDAARAEFNDAIAEMSRRAQDRAECTRRMEADRNALDADRNYWKAIAEQRSPALPDDAVSLAESFLAGGESSPIFHNTTVRLARAVLALRDQLAAVQRDRDQLARDLNAG